MAISVRIKNVASTLFKHPVRSFKAGAEFLSKPIAKSKTIAGTFPLSPVGGAGIAVKVAGSAGRAVKGVRNIISRQFTNPFAGVSVKQGLVNVGKRLGGYALTGGLFGAAYTGSKSLVTGGSPSGGTVARGFLHGTTAGLNPVGALAGTAVGLAEKYGGAVEKAAGGYTSSPEYFKQLFGMYTPSLPTGFGSPSPQFNIELPTMQPLQMPSFSTGGTSVSLGQGGSDMTPLILALIASGGLGYALGRRRRKKKKYKKRRKR